MSLWAKKDKEKKRKVNSIFRCFTELVKFKINIDIHVYTLMVRDAIPIYCLKDLNLKLTITFNAF